MTNIECLDSSDYDECGGTVEYRIAMSPTGISYPRCEVHFEQRWESQQRISRDYGVPTYYYGDEGYDDDY